MLTIHCCCFLLLLVLPTWYVRRCGRNATLRDLNGLGMPALISGEAAVHALLRGSAETCLVKLVVADDDECHHSGASYNHLTRELTLSHDMAIRRTLPGIWAAAHELGHAMQSHGRLRTLMFWGRHTFFFWPGIWVTAEALAMLAAIGLTLLSLRESSVLYAILAGLCAFAPAATDWCFVLIEADASRRALRMLPEVAELHSRPWFVLTSRVFLQTYVASAIRSTVAPLWLLVPLLCR